MSETQNKIQEYSPIEGQIHEFGQDVQEKVYDLTTTKGFNELKSDRGKVRKIRTSLEKVRKALKAGVLKRGKEIDNEARRLTTIIEVYEDPIADKYDIEVARREKEKREKAEAHRKWEAGCRATITKLATPLPMGTTREKADEHLEWLESTVIKKEYFKRFTEEAQRARAEGFQNVQATVKSIQAAEAREAELKALQEEKAEREAADKADQGREEAQEEPQEEPEPEPTSDGSGPQDPAQGEQERAMDAARVVKAGLETGFSPLVARALDGMDQDEEPVREGTYETDTGDLEADGWVAVREAPDEEQWLDVATTSTTLEASARKAEILNVRKSREGNPVVMITKVRIVEVME